MLAFCPRCGAELPDEFRGEWFETSLRCSECGVGTEASSPLAPSDQEVAYTVSDWRAIDRSAITGALDEDDIPYRWERGLVLVVPASTEARVDRLLRDLAVADHARNDMQEDEAVDGGEDAKAAMDELFLAADRLQHAPLDTRVGADMSRAASAVGASLPPYGIDRQVWRHIQQLASDVVSAVNVMAAEDVVVAKASALRGLLREYV